MAVTSFDVQYSFSFVIILLVLTLTCQTTTRGRYSDLKEELNFHDWLVIFILTSLEAVFCYFMCSLSDWVILSYSKSWHTNTDCKLASSHQSLVIRKVNCTVGCNTDVLKLVPATQTLYYTELFVASDIPLIVLSESTQNFIISLFFTTKPKPLCSPPSLLFGCYHNVFYAGMKQENCGNSPPFNIDANDRWSFTSSLQCVLVV